MKMVCILTWPNGFSIVFQCHGCWLSVFQRPCSQHGWVQFVYVTGVSCQCGLHWDIRRQCVLVGVKSYFSVWYLDLPTSWHSSHLEMDPQDTLIWPIILCSSWKTLELLLFGKGSVLCTVSVNSLLLLYKKNSMQVFFKTGVDVNSYLNTFVALAVLKRSISTCCVGVLVGLRAFFGFDGDGET